MEEIIKIEISDNEYEDIASEFKSLISDEYVVEIQKDEEEHLYATGETIAIIIIFGDFFLKAIASGMTYDLVKTGIVNAFSKLKSLFPKQTKRISLQHKVDDTTVEFELETNLSEDIIKDVIEKSFNQTNKLKEITKEKKYKSEEGNCLLKFNESTGNWEPVDFDEMREYFKKQQEELGNKFED